jgi:hypothetical protein
MFSFSTTKSVVDCPFFPPIDVQGAGWEVALISFATTNTIPNIEEGYNRFHFYTPVNQVQATETTSWTPTDIKKKKKKNKKEKAVDEELLLEEDGIAIPSMGGELKLESITVPEGTYEFEDLRLFLKSELYHKWGVDLTMRINKHIMKVEIRCSHKVDFTQPGSIGQVLGFSNSRILEPPGIYYKSDSVIGISGLNVIRIECNIASGSYTNGIEDHILYEFPPEVDPGYKIEVVPPNPIYLPINTHRIDNIILRIIDEKGKLLNFRGESINIRLHLRRR